MCVRADVRFRQILLSFDEVQQNSTRSDRASKHGCSLHKSSIFKVQFECCNTIKAGQSRILNGTVWAGCIVNEYVPAERRKMGVRAGVRFRQKLLSCDELRKTAREAIAQVSMDACSVHKSIMFKVQFECCNTNQGCPNSHSLQKSVSMLCSK